MAVKLILDSTADLRASLRGQLPTVPLTVRFGAAEYLDGVTISRQAFYEKLSADPNHPTTSQAGPEQFLSEFAKLSSQDSGVVITIGSNLSGTYQSACIAAAEYENVYVVDSGTTTIGIGILAEYALMLIRQGLTGAQVAQRLEEKKEKLRLFAVVDTLEYLKRGGRISAAAALGGSLLKIKPLIRVDRGELVNLEKLRGSRQANRRLAQLILENKPDRELPILLGYTGSEDENLREFLLQTEKLWLPEGKGTQSAMVGSVVGAHAGPGAWAVAFFAQ